MPQTKDVYVNLKHKIVAIELKEGQTVPLETVKDLMKDAGYEVTRIETVNQSAQEIKAGIDGTLICCAIPALLVALGAGAALSSLVSAVPQLVWFSENKTAVFGFATVMLAASGIMQWRARRLPCPADPALAETCMRARRMSVWTYAFSVLIFLIGGFFVFVAPLLD